MESYPNDADGDALRRVAAAGSDMNREMLIDFFIAVPDELRGRRVASNAQDLGYETAVEYDEEDDAWTCSCSKVMVPTYEGVISSQEELDVIAKPFGGFSDGWGTFGNRQ